jgi:hypothetical protein
MRVFCASVIDIHMHGAVDLLVSAVRVDGRDARGAVDDGTGGRDDRNEGRAREPR